MKEFELRIAFIGMDLKWSLLELITKKLGPTRGWVRSLHYLFYQNILVLHIYFIAFIVSLCGPIVFRTNVLWSSIDGKSAIKT